jgi:hypothetical protein
MISKRQRARLATVRSNIQADQAGGDDLLRARHSTANNEAQAGVLVRDRGRRGEEWR